jgi:spore coat protein U-like protein
MFRTKARAIVVSGLMGGTAIILPVSSTVAATANTTFQITATVSATCLISATNLAFGTYSGTAVNATSTVTVTCTNTTPYNVGLDAGTSTGANVNGRKMTGPGSATLGYSLYQDSAHTTIWGNTVGTNTEAGTGSGSAQALTVYGQLPAGQFVAPGSYTDTITATITY